MPFEERGANGISYLKDDYVPGDLGFDPLGLSPQKGPITFDNMTPKFKERVTSELMVGRVAMLAVAGIVAQEWVDGHTIVAHFEEAGLRHLGYQH